MKDINIAITSIGLDGEEIDQVTYLDKPRVYALTGYLIATAKETLKTFEAEYEILEETSIFSPLGNVVIAKITKPGNVLIAGPSIVSDMGILIHILSKYSLKNIFIDGAFSRHSLAKIADSTIYVIGANLSSDIEVVVKDAVANFKKFNLKKAPEELNYLQKYNHVCLVNEQKEVKEIPVNTLLGNTHEIFNESNIKYQLIYLPRALTNEFVELMISKRRVYSFDIVVDSPTNIQLNLANLINLFKLSISIYVLNSVNISAVFYNPVSPRGYSFDKKQFKRILEEKLCVEVFNVMEDM